MSRAVIQESFGGPEVLQVREVAQPHAGPGEVRVRVSAAGLNPVEQTRAAVELQRAGHVHGKVVITLT